MCVYFNFVYKNILLHNYSFRFVKYTLGPSWNYNFIIMIYCCYSKYDLLIEIADCKSEELKEMTKLGYPA